MFLIQCQCGATNGATGERCVECGADLTPPTAESRAKSSLLWALAWCAIGLMWLITESTELYRAAPPVSAGAELQYRVYQIFGRWGIWVPAVASWSIAARELWRAWRLKSDTRSDGAPESHAVVATGPLDSSSTSQPASGVRLYWLLGVFVGLTTALCLLTTLAGIAPILRPDVLSKQIAYGSSVIAAALVIAGFAFNARSAATLMWLMLEGAVTMAGVGYFLTADPISTVVLGSAIAAFGWCYPRQVHSDG